MPPRILLACLAAFAASAIAAPQTVCTVTVNSTDERDVLRRHLPEDRYRLVELVEPGRPDWFAAACRAQVACDVLVVSGHFAGSEFYSSRPAMRETLRVDDMERALCSESCPGVFANLKEVYLFGCDTLKPEAVRYGETTRDLMRRLFANVPVIYGFSSLAPLGRHAGPMLDGLMRSEAGQEFGSARPNARLLSLFGPSSMVATTGQSVPAARDASCAFYDERRGQGERLAAWHTLLAAPGEVVRAQFDRAEAFFTQLDPSTLDVPGRLAWDDLVADRATRHAFMQLTRATRDPALRVRMIAFATRFAWLTADEVRAEHVALARDVVTDRAMDYGEVELVCGLNRDGALEAGGATKGLAAMTAPQAAALACLGDGRARERVLAAIASEDEREVRAAQAYLRHRPLEDGDAMRHVVGGIVRMKAGPAQVRALETLARQRLDAASIAPLLDLYVRTRAVAVQHAIAEILLRNAPAPAQAKVVLRTHRLAQGPDIIDAVIAQ